MTRGALALLIPEEALPLILIAATLALLFGARKIAVSLIALSILIVVAPLILEPAIAVLPDWALVVVIVGVVLVTLSSLVTLLIGRKNMRILFEHWKARAVLRLVLSTLLLPFRIIYAFGRFLFRGLRHDHTP